MWVGVLGSSALAVGSWSLLTERWYFSKLEDSGSIEVHTINSATTYYEEQDRMVGFEHDLATAFGEFLDVKIDFIVHDSIQNLLNSLPGKQFAFGAANLTKTDARERNFAFGPVYAQVQPRLVCRKGSKVSRDLANIGEASIWITQSGSYRSALEQFQEKHPKTDWKEFANFPTEALLFSVWKRETDCTVSDSNIFRVYRRYYPELVEVAPLGSTSEIAWAMPKQARRLQSLMRRFFGSMQESGKLDSLRFRYFGHVRSFDYVDTKRFFHRIRTRLPKYRRTFNAAAKRYGFDWTFLAAVAYQESHWNPNAVSPTGVRGMMMLTQATAGSVGVTRREDPGQSIWGGARYLKRLYDRIPEEVPEEDRVWFTLAAYNMGYGHLKDARLLAEKLGVNPNEWRFVREVIPLLTEKEYYKDLPHGYARGHEALTYVSRIRDYHDLLIQASRRRLERIEPGQVLSRSEASMNETDSE